MRHLRITLGLAATVCAFAVIATPALAHEFISSGGASKGKGEEQEFRFGPFVITCDRARTKGSEMTPMMSETFFTSVTLMRCTTGAHLGGNEIHLKTKFVTPIAIEYHANGFVEIGSEGEEVEGNTTLKGGTIEVKIHAIKCLIKVPEQTLPFKAVRDPEAEYEAARYENEPSEQGKRKFNKLRIENEFKSIHFEYGEGQCEEFKTSEEERKSGKYTGELLEEVRGGNLEFQ